MAARKSGSDFQNTGPLSYLEEVPFKLNDKFRCPAKVGLPIGFCLQDCGALLAEVQYDFSLERRSVRWGEELADARAAQERARLRAEAALAEQEAQETAAASQDSDGRPEGHTPDEQDLLPPALNPVLAGLRHNAILTPLPAPSLGPVRHPSPPPPPPQSLNLADFEREEDPFDKLELKTLDDREELRSILQVQSATPPDPAPRSRSSTPPPAPAPAPNPAPAPAPAPKPALFHKPNGLVALLDLDGHGGGGLGQLENDRPCNIRSLTFPKLSDPGDPAPPRSLPNGGPLSSAGVKNDVGRSQDPHNGTPKEPGLVPAAGVVSPPGGGPGQCGALFSLSPSERQCVETIVGMGYSYEGVMKAMQRQGQNVEQVLDYLFVHARLCERGFDASAVEECLEMYQCSEEKALEFLQLMSRFGEMGFERDAIKEVLLEHNNDQDKALEDLMARAAAS
ncbi:ubiquitin-associated protein 1 [Anguilla anguilla]|uniref:ubiquitin-associated protein 1 n=1 Tax=Anguilla anguilla TaxID=7936 RepID=UPI0015AC66C8|nr:ubiquitin-associated protein 1 [Anguilla anguilla]